MITQDINGWKIVKPAQPGKHFLARMECECVDCGATNIFFVSNIKRKKIKACYCKTNLSPIKRGDKFNLWTVIEGLGADQHGELFFLCECQCGARGKVRASALRHGKSKMCRACADQIRNEKNLKTIDGQKFGKLTVIKAVHKNNYPRNAWLQCQCECGNTSIVYRSNLTSKKQISCGCAILRGPQYDTYSKRISYAEKVFRDEKDHNVLNVLCVYCGRRFVPSKSQIALRTQYLEGKRECGESLFYCSNECKTECPTFNKIKYPKGYKIASSREVNPVLRQLVFERDDWLCQKCGAKQSLHCHHIFPAKQNPFSQNDPDICITLCKKCHNFIHTQIDGCKYHDLKCSG